MTVSEHSKLKSRSFWCLCPTRPSNQ